MRPLPTLLALTAAAAFGGFAATAVQDFPAPLLGSIEPWHLIANEANIINCQYNSGSNGTLFQG
ncbi:MAG: hypothetical protein LH491_06270, partial [Pseudoxanthomonas sp.]|nr:hypothetical protein [Pseudoxanthomonas sp.]